MLVICVSRWRAANLASDLDRICNILQQGRTLVVPSPLVSLLEMLLLNVWDKYWVLKNIPQVCVAKGWGCALTAVACSHVPLWT